MTTYAVTITPRPASEPGALDGYEVRCSCGDVQTSSLFGLAQELGHAHLRWHARVERGRQLIAEVRP